MPRQYPELVLGTPRGDAALQLLCPNSELVDEGPRQISLRYLKATYFVEDSDGNCLYDHGAGMFVTKTRRVRIPRGNILARADGRRP